MKKLLILVALFVLSSIACASTKQDIGATANARRQASATQQQYSLLTATVVTWTPSPTTRATSTPKATDTPTPAAKIFENVEGRGGIEVFPEPNRQSGRIFAAVSNFKPHVAGVSEDGEWVFILYFDGELQSGWSPKSELVLTETQINHLQVIDPNSPPELPILAYSEQAALPYGVVSNASKPTEAPVEQIQPTQSPASSVTNQDLPLTTATKTNTPRPTTLPVQSIDLDNLSGFRLENKLDAGSFTIYTYSSGSYVITLAIMSTSIHDYLAQFPLNHTTQTINGIEVELGFNESLFDIPAYSTLAFDIPYHGNYVTGEISHSQFQSSKEGLLNTIDRLVHVIFQ